MRIARPRAPTLPIVLVTAMLLVASCTIETSESTTGSTLEEAATTVPEEGGTTVPDQDQPQLADVGVELSEPVASYDVALDLVGTSPGSESIFLGDPAGRIYEVKRDEVRNTETGTTSFSLRPQTSPFLDVSRQSVSQEGREALHGFAFSTDGKRLYVSYTARDGATRVDEFRVSGGRVSPTSQRELLRIEQPEGTQNAGPLMLGPDGFLHVALGDGGGRGDPFGNGQDPTTPLGAILRVDPEAGEGVAYNIPLGNPYNGENGAREVYLTGVRHPADLSWDPVSRDIWIADRGQDGVQEITRIPWEGEPPTGGNLGWPVMNGTEPLGDGEAPDGHLAPVFEYGPDSGCEIVGGVAYRGSGIPGLQGAYVFGDRCTGNLLALRVDPEADTETPEVSDWVVLPVRVPAETLGAVGTDPDGELVVVTTTGQVHQIRHVPPPPG